MMKVKAHSGKEWFDVEFRNVPVADSGLEIGDAIPLPKRPTPLATNDAEGFVFDFEQCRNAGSKLKCSFAVTNTEPDRDITFHGRDGLYSRIFDEEGNEARSVAGQLADRRATLNGHNDSLIKTVIKDVPVALELSFDAPSGDTGSIARMTLKAHSGKDWFEVEFRNQTIAQ